LPPGFRGRGFIAYLPLLFLCLCGLFFPIAGLAPAICCAAPITVLYSLPESQAKALLPAA